MQGQARAGFSSKPRPARPEAKRSRKRPEHPLLLDSRARQTEASRQRSALPRPPQRRFPQTPGGDSRAPPPPPPRPAGYCSFPRAASPGRAGPAEAAAWCPRGERGRSPVRERCGVGAETAPLRGPGRSRRRAGLGESRRQRPPAGTAEPPAHRERCPGRAPRRSCAEGCGRSACGACRWKRFTRCFLNKGRKVLLVVVG